ncbi:MAG: transporter substrate-binding domain-containing protein [Spirochaetia bacterium]|nr:transporter substrate-binding domain-containing protein [Spirochaetia bacterium]
MKKITLAAILLLALVTTQVFAQGAKEQKKDDKTIVMASNCEWPPLEFVDENGKITGFEIELLQKLGEVTGYNFVVKNVAWDGIFAGLANGAYDGVASGVSITEERKPKMEFTDPILDVTQAIISPIGAKDAAKDIQGLVGKRVGDQMGTTGDIALHDSGLNITIRGYDSIGLAVEDLLNGNLDCVVTDSVVASEYVLQNKNYKDKLEVSGIASDITEPIAMCFQKGDTFHTQIVNEGLKKLKADGTLKALKEKWKLL